MYLGTQMSGSQFQQMGEPYLRQLAQLGVVHVCIDPPGSPYEWTRDSLMRHRDRLGELGLQLEMVQLPLTSRPVEESDSKAILLGGGAERDRQIDAICRLIETLGALGIRATKYNLNLIGIPRTEREIGRGGASLSSFRHERTTNDGEIGLAGEVGAELFWERITYFLERVVPVAEASRVQLACHPHDPLTRPGYRGVTRVLGDVAGLKRFVETCDNPWHGLNFCQGTVAESLEDPDAEIDAVIRWFGSRGKIFNVHFRNIRGGKYSFSETFPDDGSMDMARTFGVYREVGYKYMIMPDHVPHIDGAAPTETAFAFAFGYIAGLFQANGLPPAGPAA